MHIYNRRWLLAGLFCCVQTALAAPADRSPIISLASDQAAIGTGGSVQLSWSTANADNCVATGNWAGPKGLEGAERSPTMDAPGSYQFGLTCSNSAAEVSRNVIVIASGGSEPLYESAWIAEPKVVKHRSAFSQAHSKWRIRFRLASVGSQQTLVSYDEKHQQTAGHTTVFIDKRGYVQVRHQDGESGTYTTRSRSRVKSGTDHELLLEIKKGESLSLSLDGKLEATSRHAFGTDETVRDLVLGASCTYCSPGTTTPLREPIDGVMSFAVIPIEIRGGDDQAPKQDDADSPVGGGNGDSNDSSDGTLYESAWVGTPQVVEHRAAFSQTHPKWRVRFRLASVGKRQTLVSYDEIEQRTAGQTTIFVDHRGYVRVRHQDDANGSYTTRSRSKVKAETDYELLVEMKKGSRLVLSLNGKTEASSRYAFGTADTVRSLVLGASCSFCEPGTTQPQRDPIDGVVSFAVLATGEGSTGSGNSSGTGNGSSNGNGSDVEPKDPQVDPTPLEHTATDVPRIIPFQPEFAQSDTVWHTRFKLNRVDRQQTLFSYDEKYQRTSGHTTLSITPAGYLSLRHQDDGDQTIVLTSDTRLQANREYSAKVIILDNRLLALELDGVRQASSDKAFSTAATRRDLILGGSCTHCDPGTTSPRIEPLRGTVTLQVTAPNATAGEQPQSNVEDSPVQAPTQPTPPSSSPVEPDPAPSPKPQPNTPQSSGSGPETTPKPSLNFSASRSGVIAGESVTLSWTTDNANQCTASGAWSGGQALAGELIVLPQHSARTYSLQCSGPGGTASGIVTIGVQTEVVVRWLPPTTNTDGSAINQGQLQGYVVHYGSSSGDYTNQIEVNNPTSRSQALYLPGGEYFFAVTAVNAEGLASDFSGEVAKSIR